MIGRLRFPVAPRASSTPFSTVALVGLSLALQPGPAAAQLTTSRGPGTAPVVEARVWLDRGQEPLLRTGDQVRVYYRTTEDAYVAIFHIDTDGTTSLIFPRSPDEDHFVRGGRDYRLLFPRSPYWYVDDAPGVGYFFVVASPEPFDFSRFRFSRYDVGWDLELVGRQVYRDPYLAMDDYVAALLPDWERVPYALDFTTYNVGEQRFAYPRFLCYDCHGFKPYAAWNPYYAACTNFRVVIYDDPYFYPARRYRADRVVWPRPAPDLNRYGFRKRFPGEPSEPLIEQIVGERTRGVVAPAPRRSAVGGAGGVAPGSERPTGAVGAPSPQRTPVGTARGRATPVVPTDAGERAPVRVVRPTDRVRGSPSGGAGDPPPVTAPTSGAIAPGTEVPALSGDRSGGVSAPAVDPRLRPVLRRRPSEGAGTSAPASGAEPQPAPQDRPAGASPSLPRARPRDEPAPSGQRQPAARPPTTREPAPSPSGERPAVRRQPPGGESSGGGEQPTVRTTPDGRPVIRRPPPG
jgi:hypothetical protein